MAEVGNRMIPRINPDGSKNLFGSKLGSSGLALPGQEVNFSDFKGMPRAWRSAFKLPGQNSESSSEIFYGDNNQSKTEADAYF